MERELRPNEFRREEGALRILDQSRLPGEIVYKDLTTAEQVFRAIRNLEVRGAPAIGVAAAFGAYLGVREAAGDEGAQLREKLKEVCRYLAGARPTAVNLSWALERMERRLEQPDCAGASASRLADILLTEAEQILAEDEAQNQAIAQQGLSLLEPGMGLLTHCNAGPLATSRYGTALGPILLGQEQGYGFHVYADETRPLLQGARLTAYELQQAGIDCTLICDNMASLVMKEGKINACFVGCDRVARNGDTANKIGTSGVAILAKHYGIPFYVLGPSSTIDFTCPDGDHIPIELRDGGEIKEKFFSTPVALPQVKCYNPAFDVTDHSLITAIVTEKGICYPPFEQSFAQVFGRPEKEAT